MTTIDRRLFDLDKMGIDIQVGPLRRASVTTRLIQK